MEGFIVFDYASQYPQARAELAQWLSEGKIQRKETIVQGGLAKAGEALVSLYKGSNTGMSFARPQKSFDRSKDLVYSCLLRRKTTRRGLPARANRQSQPVSRRAEWISHDSYGLKASNYATPH